MKASAHQIRFRPATIGDLQLLRHWDDQPHVQQSDPNDDWMWETELVRSPSWREQLIAELDGRPIGFTQIIDPYDEETHYWGDVPQGLRAIDMWIGGERDLNQGWGTQMMRLVLMRCFSDPTVTAVLVDPLASNLRAHRFYQRCGFRFLQQKRFGRDDCHVYQLMRSEYELPSSSPFCGSSSLQKSGDWASS